MIVEKLRCFGDHYNLKKSGAGENALTLNFLLVGPMTMLNLPVMGTVAVILTTVLNVSASLL